MNAEFYKRAVRCLVHQLPKVSYENTDTDFIV